MDDNYYMKRRVKMLADFDSVSKRAVPSLTTLGGPSFSAAVISETRDHFEQLLPQLPDVGGRKNPFISVIEITGWLISLQRAMNARDRQVQDTIRVACDVADSAYRSLSRRWLRIGGWCAVRRLPRMIAKHYAKQSRKRRYPDDWVFNVVEGGDFDWGMEFEQCAVIKLFQAHECMEMAPYCNFYDLTYSRYMDLGLDASETLGLGCDKCRLLFKRGRPTQIPAQLTNLMPPL